LGGSFATPITLRTTSLTLDETHHTIRASGTLTLTLPTASSTAGRQYLVKYMGGGTCTVTGSGFGDTVEGAGGITITTRNKAVQLISDGTNWLITNFYTGVWNS